MKRATEVNNFVKHMVYVSTQVFTQVASAKSTDFDELRQPIYVELSCFILLKF